MTQEALQIGQTNDFGGVVDDIDLEEITPEDRGDAIVNDTSEPANDTAEPEVAETPSPKPEETEAPAAESEKDKTSEVEEVDPEPEPEPEPEPDDKGYKVPVSRLNKEVEKRREAESKFEELQKQVETLQQQVNQPAPAPEPETPSEPEYNVAAKMQEAMTMAMDGELEKSSALMAEVMAKSNQQAVAQATQASKQDYTQMSAADKEQAMLADKAEQIVADFPVFNKDSDTFDAGLMEELIDYRDAFFAKGHAAHEALEKAKDTVVRLHGLGQTQAEEPAPVEAPKKDIKKAVDAAIKTPPKSSGELDTEKATRSIEEFTEDEFESLSPSELKKLRGDFD